MRLIAACGVCCGLWLGCTGTTTGTTESTSSSASSASSTSGGASSLAVTSSSAAGTSSASVAGSSSSTGSSRVTSSSAAAASSGAASLASGSSSASSSSAAPSSSAAASSSAATTSSSQGPLSSSLGAGSSSASSASSSSSSGAPAAQLLEVRDVTLLGMTYPVELWRLPNALGGNSYAQWIAPTGTDARPAVLLTRPYDGIDWTGEAVDLRWASRPDAATTGYAHDDDEEPSFVPGGSQIRYRTSSPQEVANEAAFFLYNRMGVLSVFGRFYAGGSVANDVQDMVAGTVFLSNHPRVMADRVGIMGGSWGGFNALYGAAYAPAGARPRVGVALFPAADFEALTAWVQTGVYDAVTLPAREDAFRQFYDPYLRRILATVGPTPSSDFTGYRSQDVVALAPIPWLVVHDAWDLLIPFAHSVTLAALDPTHVHPLWYRHDQPVNQDTMPMDHGPLGSATVLAAYQTFALAFLQVELEPGPATTVGIPYGAQDLANYLTETHAQQAQGADVTFVTERLLQLCDPRVVMVDMTPQNPLPVMTGRALVAAGINLVWGTTLTESDVETQLTTSGLPPP